MQYELPPEQLDNVHEAMRLVRETEELCQRMSRAGYNVEAQDRFCQAMKERLQAVLKEFGPSVRKA